MSLLVRFFSQDDCQTGGDCGVEGQLGSGCSVSGMDIGTRRRKKRWFRINTLPPLVGLDIITVVRANLSNNTIDVPELSLGVLNGNM